MVFFKKEEAKKVEDTKKVISDIEMPQLPRYESAINDIKSEVERPQIELPMRRPMLMERNIVVPQRIPSPVMHEEKSVFVKIENYKDALKDIEEIRHKISNVESVLRELEVLKSREDRELERWNTDIKSIKDKLLEIDKKLFEL